MCLHATTERPPGIDQPEPANEEGGCRQAEIVRRRVTHNVLLAQKFALHGLDRAHEARVFDLDDAEIGQQQNAGIEVIGSKRRGKGLSLVVPSAAEERIEDGLSDGVPMGGAIRKPKLRGNSSKALTACPAHRGRMGMDALSAA